MKIGFLTLFTLISTHLLAQTEPLTLTQLNGTSSHIDGPNCWNGALYVAGILEHRRMLAPEEWLYYLESSCEEVESPQKGDVGRVYHSQKGEVHGFIHLDYQTLFAKHGESTLYGYQIMSYQKMLKDYGRTRHCLIHRNFSPQCFHKIKYYRCTGRPFIPVELKRVNEHLENLTFSPQTKYHYKETCQGKVFQERAFHLEQIRLSLNQYILQGMPGDRALMSKIAQSYRDQFYRIQVSNRHFKCKKEDRKKRDKKLKQIRELLLQFPGQKN